jgi:hypothetical protein
MGVFSWRAGLRLRRQGKPTRTSQTLSDERLFPIKTTKAMNLTSRKTALSALTIASLSLLGAVTDAHAEGTFLPTGQTITPTAIPNSQLTYLKPGFADAPQFIASGGISSLVSPDQKTLLVLTSGYNLTTDSQGNAINDASQEYVFVYDISSHSPVQKQVIQVPNSFAGIVFSPTVRHCTSVAV